MAKPTMWLFIALAVIVVVGGNSSLVVAFGSCSFRYEVRNLTTFVSIANEHPQYFLHIGDVVYLDKQG